MPTFSSDWYRDVKVRLEAVFSDKMPSARESCCRTCRNRKLRTHLVHGIVREVGEGVFEVEGVGLDVFFLRGSCKVNEKVR
jgi:hypothetical protein